MRNRAIHDHSRMILNVPGEPAGSRALRKALGGNVPFPEEERKSASLELPDAPAPTTCCGVHIGTVCYSVCAHSGGLFALGCPQNAVALWGVGGKAASQDP